MEKYWIDCYWLTWLHSLTYCMLFWTSADCQFGKLEIQNSLQKGKCTTVEMAENANFHPLCIIILFCTTNCRSWIWVSAMVDAVQWYPFAFSFLMQLTRCCYYSTKWLSVCKCDLCTESHIQLSLSLLLRLSILEKKQILALHCSIVDKELVAM